MEDLKELKEKKINELRNSFFMIQSTLDETEKKGSKSRYEEVLKLYQNKLKELNFVQSLNDKEFMVYLNLPFSKIREIIPFDFYDVSKEFEEYLKIFKNIINSVEKSEDVEDIQNSITGTLSIAEPLRKNHFLVYIPSYFNVSVKDVVSFDYNRENKTILITAREGCGKEQIKRILNFLNDDSNNGVPYQDIKVQHLTPSYDIEYTHVFKGVVLENFYEEPLTYQVKHDADNLRYFQMTFKYDKDSIE